MVIPMNKHSPVMCKHYSPTVMYVDGEFSCLYEKYIFYKWLSTSSFFAFIVRIVIVYM